jgi:hypothetical protein
MPFLTQLNEVTNVTQFVMPGRKACAGATKNTNRVA